MAGSFDLLYNGAVTGTKVEVSAVPVDIGAYHILNNDAGVRYLQVFFLPAASVTVGTTTPDVSLPLPASGGATLNLEGKGWRTRGSGLTLAVTTGRANATTGTADVVLWRAR